MRVSSQKNNEGEIKMKPFMDMDEACEYLSISKHTMYKYTHKKIIPFYRLNGRKLYFKREELDAFILNKANRVSSQEEIESKAATEYLKNKLD